VARILVFDSGVGGLSILDALQRHNSTTDHAHQWLFCSDNAFFPYGTRQEAELVTRVSTVIAALDLHFQPDVIVIACNTASTVALQTLRTIIKTPVVGVVPAIKPAAAISQSRVIGLLATPGTIQRPYTDQLIRDFAQDCTVLRVGSSELVGMTENYLRTGSIDQTRLKNILAPLQDAITLQTLDTVVLACTHFPLLSESLRSALPDVKHWIDSGEAIARRVDWCLEHAMQPRRASTSRQNLAVFTQDDPTLDNLRPALAQYGLNEMQIFPVT
jgi:glutamate racemase